MKLKMNKTLLELKKILGYQKNSKIRPSKAMKNSKKVIKR